MSDLQFLSDTCTGRKYNETGQLSPWWTNASIEAFNERAKCYVEQYSKYELFGIHVSDLYIIQSFLLVCWSWLSSCTFRSMASRLSERTLLTMAAFESLSGLVLYWSCTVCISLTSVASFSASHTLLCKEGLFYIVTGTWAQYMQICRNNIS